MATFTLDDLAKLVKDRCDGSTPFTTAIPGAAYYDRGPDNPTAYPYCVFKFEPRGEPKFMTDSSRMQEYSLRLVAYCPPATTVTDPGSVQQAIDDAITKDPTTWAALPVGKVIHCLPRPIDNKFDRTLRAGQDVFMVGRQWTLLVQETAG